MLNVVASALVSCSVTCCTALRSISATLAGLATTSPGGATQFGGVPV
jgi:hypothetical protein